MQSPPFTVGHVVAGKGSEKHVPLGTATAAASYLLAAIVGPCVQVPYKGSIISSVFVVE